MLSILVYRSRIKHDLTAADLAHVEQVSRERNKLMDITGILLFDGLYFFQYMEGPEEAIQHTYSLICQDNRHHHIVKLLDDYARCRRFSIWNMRLLDLRTTPLTQLTDALNAGHIQHPPPLNEDRALRLVQAFIAGRWKNQAAEYQNPAKWQFIPNTPARQTTIPVTDTTLCQFALQPIINTAKNSITSLEALIRSNTGGSPEECFSAIPAEQYHLFDLHSKRHAFELASKLNIGNAKLSINLLPMSLTQVPDAVNYLARQVAEYGLEPERIIIEITEAEAISHFHDFQSALKQLRSFGFGVAIDDFGAGFAGLSLLSKFQPEKLKIDRSLISDIHIDGPRQAIVRAIIECCHSLGIIVVAEGVEQAEEWCWLRAAGIELFQGFLFARPIINGIPAVCWPVSNTIAVV